MPDLPHDPRLIQLREFATLRAKARPAAVPTTQGDAK